MASYSIAVGQECLPDLINRAVAGEEVIIEREGERLVELRAIRSHPRPADVKLATDRLRSRIEAQAPLAIPSAGLRAWLYPEDHG